MPQCKNCDYDTTDERLGHVRIDCPSGGDAVIDADWCPVCRSEAVARLVAERSAFDPNTDYNTVHVITTMKYGPRGWEEDGPGHQTDRIWFPGSTSPRPDRSISVTWQPVGNPVADPESWLDSSVSTDAVGEADPAATYDQFVRRAEYTSSSGQKPER